jgi:hypothetical protein
MVAARYNRVEVACKMFASGDAAITARNNQYESAQDIARANGSREIE